MTNQAPASPLGARLAGQLAFLAGCKICPYVERTPLWFDWWRGYREMTGG